MKPRVVVATVLTMFLLILVVQNTEVVEIRLLFWSFSMSRVILILLAVLTGFACGYVVARMTGARSRES